MRIIGKAKIKKICNLFLQRGVKKRGEILKSLTSGQMHLICELFFNIINNPDFCNFTMSQKKKLCRIMAPHKKDFKVMTDKKMGLKKQKIAVLRQTGSGIITAILAIAIPALITLISKK